ncbi:MAG: serine/threonine protein kinase [Betaproteobacteria bacterium]|nr:serine/threonine protein kinase [Betaproteobacteria bacterium]
MINATSVTTLGRYEIISELGQGAMGVVYKARDPMLDRLVAIKTINLTLPKEELAEYEARFYQEAKAAGGLSHRNIVTIHDIGRSDRVAYMAMEFLEGQELRRLMQSRVPIRVAHALDIGAQVAEGLQFAHDRQIVHRDIKPANIMVLNDGLVKITDFGIARMRNNEVKTIAGMILGSPKYMSPEQVSGKRADARSDIFSLGVVLYEMLTGTSPFVADNIHGVMYQTLNFNPPAPRTLNPELPDVFNYIVAKALSKNLDDRYQTAKDLSHDLRQALSALSGESTAPRVAADPVDAPFVEPDSPMTRQEDKEARILGMVDEDAQQSGAESVPANAPSSATETAHPGLGLSKAFDSFDATMRLAALTGMEKELDKFSETQKIARLKALADAKRAAAASASTLSGSATWQQSAAGGQNTAPAGAMAAQLKLIWIGSGLMVFAAAVLFLLR